MIVEDQKTGGREGKADEADDDQDHNEKSSFYVFGLPFLVGDCFCFFQVNC